MFSGSRSLGRMPRQVAGVGRRVTRGVVEPARELGSRLLRVTNGLRGGTAARHTSAKTIGESPDPMSSRRGVA